MKEGLKFITWPAIAGLLAALLILDRWILPQPGNTGHRAAASATYAEAVRKATPGVVNIYIAKLVKTGNPLVQERLTLAQRMPRQRIERSLGSGVIMTAEGHILTNHHVIAGADAIQVLLHDGRSASARVIGSDIATDLAVLKIDLPELSPVEPADSDVLQVGDVVLAIGNPLGFGHTVTQGIVSALGRYGLQLNTYEDYIQTDAIIHQGNSGGALIDTRGKLLGINTLIYTASNQDGTSPTGIGISLAIPINLASYVMRDLIEYGEVIRGWLGVSVEPVRMTTGGQQQALLVVAMAENSPAKRAGVETGDLITHIDGEAVLDGRQTMHQIARLRPGDAISVTVLRDQQSLELRAVVGVQGQSSPAR
ncbi:PDZ domain-containing protein [Pseudohalioglobus sediminis]|uniref:PDZ domain-containing protein n=1 Tax=Pseudohalioglobus sediminis TaxID=2606449 RepID=A0A5B0X244_9GAMM|nr:trypsin-like peptidase domain-containing protein [Pseudohalioglobus sediminis]KAA1192775.1 PDZ domain-containing protein [Pseudohalioglobus sediminis]